MQITESAKAYHYITFTIWNYFEKFDRIVNDVAYDSRITEVLLVRIGFVEKKIEKKWNQIVSFNIEDSIEISNAHLKHGLLFFSQFRYSTEFDFCAAKILFVDYNL